MRCFIAIDLYKGVKKEIARVQKMVEPHFRGKLVEPENLHITLKFLDDIDAVTIDEVKERLSLIKFQSFDLALKKITVFKRKSIKIIWLEVDEIPLQKIIDDSLKGLFKRKSKFIGHITIARVKRFNNEIDFIKLLGDIEVNKLKIDVTEFCLKSSMLTKSGAIYKDIQTYDLS